MLFILLSTLLAIFIPVLVCVVSFLLSSRSFKDREKSSPFECGFDPKSTARLPFSLRFFLLAVLFLVFDIEIILLLPYPIIMDNFNLLMFFISIMVFLLILFMGLLHEWNEGSLDWSE
uniref:NADH-ubiquinone oxidoreductase chain 3 n=1 Tax=Eusyllis blomstrandi TaxID=199554 RepID=A0A1C9UZB1_EUSBL|nr:NADH dehydrogenase subunit 3 [Eusyllis blomstrandi]AOR87111.1 NADH dehydrogenase subunit 3 [Eusyllis blomstrandi]